MGDCNFPDICWKYNTAEWDQSQRFLECVADNFLMQLVSEPTREGALLDLLFVNREGLVDDVAVGGQLGPSDHEIIEFSILRQGEGAAELTSWTSKRLTLSCLGTCLTGSLGRWS